MIRNTSAMMLAAGLLMSPTLARADWAPPVRDPVVIKECGSCHMAFQPAFLPARSWARLMDELADHFGEDLMLAPDVAQTIRTYLTVNAGDQDARGLGRKFVRRITPEAIPSRITETPPFLRKHRLPESAWTDPKVVTKSNCQACHQAADRGFYDDD